MAIPSAYLTSAKNLDAVLTAMQQAKAPERFTQRFLESLGFKSTSDRLMIGVLKAIGFLDDQGKPTERYFQFLDQTQSKVVLAEAIRDAYADLFEVNKEAQKLDGNEVKNKLKTLSQGQYSDSVITKMATTFAGLAKLADFSSKASPVTEKQTAPADTTVPAIKEASRPSRSEPERLTWGGLHYNIQIILPESRDPKVYDALFRSLREHL